MKRRIPVRLKIAAVTATLTFSILCLFAVVIGALAEQRIRAAFDDDLRATMADLVNRFVGDLRIEARSLAGASAGGARLQLVADDGHVVYPAGSRPLARLGTEGFSDLPVYRVLSRALVLPQTGPDSIFGGPDGGPVSAPVAWVHYAKPRAGLARTIKRVRLFLVFGVVAGSLMAFLGGLHVGRRAMRPIAGLTQAARRVAHTRDPHIELPTSHANDEVTELAHTFEHMLAELSAARRETGASLDRQRAFVADASHELRTPLTSVLANLELLEPELSGEHREIAHSALHSAQRMRRLVADLLLLARTDSGRVSPQRAVNLTAIVAEAVGEAGVLSSDHPISLDLPEPVTVLGVPDDLHRLVGNLVDNALTHTPAGTSITLSVRTEGGAAVVEVADRGPGVPPPVQKRLFERFARGGDDAGGGGTGLGLAIVRAIAESHGGAVEYAGGEGGGASFRVSLPLHDPVPSPLSNVSGQSQSDV